ncbi:MAG: crotonase/enoyl-CoA hydratase family protein [Hyphomonadaceae bacterium]|nr:crotonase/enoyl-CoA hydratase family protein [Hyphomonadaceae bacterium]
MTEMLKKTHECFTVSVEDKIAHIVLNRPQAMNAMNKAFWNELPAIVKEIDASAAARVIVISSTGKHFSAGMDLSVFGDDGSVKHGKTDRHVAAEAFRSNIKQIQSSFNALEEARMPVLIACQGGVIGGAIDMISAGDIRWCTQDAFFCIQETNIAMTADVGTFPRLQRYIPEGWVKQMAYTGERLGAAKAKEIGLVNDVFDSHEAMMEHVMGVAREIASKNPIAVTGCKVLINYGRDHSTADTLDYIGVWNSGMLPPSHMQEAFAAKAEKRDPDFPDLLPLRTTPM